MKKSINFESSLERLEEIVQKLERGNLTLDESMKIFEEGVKLSKVCGDYLNDAEKKIHKLIKSEDGFQLELLESSE